MAQATVCSGDEVAVEGANFGNAQGHFFDAAFDPSNRNQWPYAHYVAHTELTFGNDEDASKNVTNDLLGTKAKTCAHNRNHWHHCSCRQVEEQERPYKGHCGNGEVDAPASCAEKSTLVSAHSIVVEWVGGCALAL